MEVFFAKKITPFSRVLQELKFSVGYGVSFQRGYIATEENSRLLVDARKLSSRVVKATTTPAAT